MRRTAPSRGSAIRAARWTTRGLGALAARPQRVVLLLATSLGACGEPSTHGLGGGGSADDAGIDPFDPAECEAAGGGFGIVDEPRRIDGALGELAQPFFRSLGLLVHDEGMWLTFLVANNGGDERTAYTVELDRDGEPLGPATPSDAQWAGGAVWPNQAAPDDEAAAVVTYCRDQVPGWVVVDAHGEPMTEPMTPPAFASCVGAPWAAWTPAGDVLLTWIDRGLYTECTTFSCVPLARVRDGTLVGLRSLHSAWDYGPGPTASIAVGRETALVVTTRWIGIDDHTELVTTLVDHLGRPLDEPLAQVIPSPSDDAEVKYSHAHAIPDDADGYFVYLGGYGPSMGRMHLDGDGQVLEPLTELPVFHELPLHSVHERSFSRIVPRPTGWIAYGSAVEHAEAVGLLTALDRQGRVAGHVQLGSPTLQVTHHGSRTWALTAEYGSRLSIAELGCVFEPG